MKIVSYSLFVLHEEGLIQHFIPSFSVLKAELHLAPPVIYLSCSSSGDGWWHGFWRSFRPKRLTRKKSTLPKQVNCDFRKWIMNFCIIFNMQMKRFPSSLAHSTLLTISLYTISILYLHNSFKCNVFFFKLLLHKLW